jgi:hypothetical protein
MFPDPGSAAKAVSAAILQKSKIQQSTATILFNKHHTPFILAAKNRHSSKRRLAAIFMQFFMQRQKVFEWISMFFSEIHIKKHYEPLMKCTPNVRQKSLIFEVHF